MTEPACNRTREPTRSAWQRYMRSPAWTALRAKAFERDGHRCVLCNRDDNLQGHHRCYPARPELDEVGNVYTLCGRCHLFLAEERSREERYRQRKIAAAAYPVPEPVARVGLEPVAVAAAAHTPTGGVARNKHEPAAVRATPGGFRRIR